MFTMKQKQIIYETCIYIYKKYIYKNTCIYIYMRKLTHTYVYICTYISISFVNIRDGFQETCTRDA